MGALDWVFEIQDMMNPALAKMQSGLAATTSSLKSTEAELAKFERAAKLDGIAKEADPVKKQHASLQLYRDDLMAQKSALEQQAGAHSSAASGASSFAGELGAILAIGAGVAAVVGELGSKVLELGVGFVKAGLGAASFKRDTMLALEAVTGSKDAAVGAYEAIGALAESSKYTREQIAGVYKELAAYGNLSENNVASITAASLSVGATQGEDAKEKLLGAIRLLKGRGSSTRVRSWN